jgi:hypothetical protein
MSFGILVFLVVGIYLTTSFLQDRRRDINTIKALREASPGTTERWLQTTDSFLVVRQGFRIFYTDTIEEGPLVHYYNGPRIVATNVGWQNSIKVHWENVLY